MIMRINDLQVPWNRVLAALGTDHSLTSGLARFTDFHLSNRRQTPEPGLTR
jgi:hypothetical protein